MRRRLLRRHSAQSKARISSSLQQVWAKRLKWKRPAEKFYSSWAESIAEAARKGGINEEELNWDSYQTLKEEMASRHLQRAAEKGRKAKEKEMKKMYLPALREFNNRKATLRKIHKKNVRDGTFCNQAGVMFYLQFALERLDTEFIKKEQWQSVVSLADQIQAAKRKRTQALTNGSTIRTSLGS